MAEGKQAEIISVKYDNKVSRLKIEFDETMFDEEKDANRLRLIDSDVILISIVSKEDGSIYNS